MCGSTWAMLILELPVYAAWGALWPWGAVACRWGPSRFLLAATGRAQSPTICWQLGRSLLQCMCQKPCQQRPLLGLPNVAQKVQADQCHQPFSAHWRFAWCLPEGQPWTRTTGPGAWCAHESLEGHSLLHGRCCDPAGRRCCIASILATMLFSFTDNVSLCQIFAFFHDQ